jgi:uncharacterized protein (DUF58 family)
MVEALYQNAQRLAAPLPPLLLEAERVAQAVSAGVHGRRRAGSGETFWQFRRYAAGDPAQRIDWRQSARTDKFFVREREWEAAQSACLWADASGSMRYTSDRNLPTKAARAQVLMLALASLLLRGGERALWLDERRTIAVHGKAGLERIAARLGGNETAIPHSNLPPAVPVARYAHMILCSDFLVPQEVLRARMQDYTARHLRGMLVHILDPMELAFGFEGRLEMEGCESEAPLTLPNAASLAAAYRARMAGHEAFLRQLAQSAGWFYLRHVTSEAPHLALLRVYQALSAEQN